MLQQITRQQRICQLHFHHRKAAAVIKGCIIIIHMAMLNGACKEKAHCRLLHQAYLAAGQHTVRQAMQAQQMGSCSTNGIQQAKSAIQTGQHEGCRYWARGKTHWSKQGLGSGASTTRHSLVTSTGCWRQSQQQRCDCATKYSMPHMTGTTADKHSMLLT